MALNKAVLLEQLRKAREAALASQEKILAPIKAACPGEHEVPKYFTSAGYPLNEEQCLAVKYAEDGNSFCLIGPAGSGKTTTLTEVVAKCIESIGRENLRYNSIAIVAFTRRAVANVTRAMEKINAKQFCRTAHKFLEYAPERTEYQTKTGEWKTGMRFMPRRHELNPHRETKIVIIEEASQIGYGELYKELRLACPNATFIFVGDLNQLKPVFGDSVLGFKLAQIPVVELTQIYRQAMDSPIVAFQHNYTLKGRYPSTADLDAISAGGKLTFRHIAKGAEPEEIAHRIWLKVIKPQIESGAFDPETDIVLCPNNNRCGQTEFNNYIADYLSKKNNELVYEVFAGINVCYLAVGDNIQVDKRDAKIVGIRPNENYGGKLPRKPSVLLDRWGQMPLLESDTEDHQTSAEDSKEKALEEYFIYTQSSEEDTSKLPASHALTIVWADDMECAEVELSTRGELGKITFNYAMTIHKAQGCEWRKVILILPPHSLRGPILCRELLYTGMTRAREYLDVLYVKNSAPGRHDGSLDACIARQSLPGKTWQEKAKHFEVKLDNLEWRD